MAFLEQYNLAIADGADPDAPDFRKRVRLAMHKVATMIQGEAQSSLTLQQWQKRGQLATTILGILQNTASTTVAASEVWIDAFALSVTQNATITSASLDSDIEFQVTAIWDDVAGVTLGSASTRAKGLRDQLSNGGNKEAARIVGEAIAKQALGVGIKCVCFDRNRYKFHGRTRVLAEAARKTGLVF